DIPGLIEGAHEGVGLGIKFLKHIERTGILVHLIDSSGIDPENPLEQFALINNELAMHSDTLANKTQVVVLNKIDLTGTENRIEAFKNALPDQSIFTISAATGKGVKTLIKHLAQLLQPAVPEDKE
ncbi:MAG TPA: 50S ribosome-binding GTPase, partial [Desulfobacter postgatei]|nr:50S ribosome-binding GTPase [Desulfobacter postgatei]